jgi:cellulase
LIVQVKAGDKLTAEWHHTLDSAGTNDPSDPIDKGHLGPIIVYLAKVDDALTTKVTGLKWFKIYEDGMDSNKEWAVTRLYNNKGKVDFTLPSCIQSGQSVCLFVFISAYTRSDSDVQIPSQGRDHRSAWRRKLSWSTAVRLPHIVCAENPPTDLGPAP